MSTAPVVASVAIQNRHILTFQGQTAVLGLELRQNGVWHKRSLVDATEIPVVTLYRPDSTIALDDVPMTVFSTGRYTYDYPTKHTDPLGLWTARFTARYLTSIAKVDHVGVFLLVASGFAVYTYFLIKDQTGKIWYWSIDTAAQAVSAATAPPDGVRMAEAINSDDVPGWVRFTNTVGETRYMYPMITGDYYIDVSPPPIGPEWVDSPIFTATNGQHYTLSGDVLDQVLVLPAPA